MKAGPDKVTVSETTEPDRQQASPKWAASRLAAPAALAPASARGLLRADRARPFDCRAAHERGSHQLVTERFTMSTRQHFGDRRSVQTTDAAPDFCLGVRDGKVVLLSDAEARALRAQTKDAILKAVPTPKLIETASKGALTILQKAKQDLFDLITPFTVGQTLTAEQSAAVIELGKVWSGVAALHQSLQRDDEAGGSAAEESEPTEPVEDTRSVGPVFAPRITGKGGGGVSAVDLQAAIDKQYGRV